MTILYEDEALVLIEKEPGLPCEATPGGHDAPTVLAKMVQSSVYTVHRLDSGTGGAMIFAKTQKDAAALSETFRSRGAEKTYLCVVEGRPEPACGRMEDLLWHDVSRNKSYVADRPRRGVKRAALTYRTVQTVGFADRTLSLCAVTLETGRTHQIRVQFASRGFPLLGDRRYGSAEKSCPTALWSHTLSLPHPRTGKPLCAVSDVPDAFPWNVFAKI